MKIAWVKHRYNRYQTLRGLVRNWKGRTEDRSTENIRLYSIAIEKIYRRTPSQGKLGNTSWRRHHRCMQRVPERQLFSIFHGRTLRPLYEIQ